MKSSFFLVITLSILFEVIMCHEIINDKSNHFYVAMLYVFSKMLPNNNKKKHIYISHRFSILHMMYEWHFIVILVSCQFSLSAGDVCHCCGWNISCCWLSFHFSSLSISILYRSFSVNFMLFCGWLNNFLFDLPWISVCYTQYRDKKPNNRRVL